MSTDYLTIPEITESEELSSVVQGSDGLTFTTTMATGDIALRLGRAFDRGEHLPLVVIVAGGQFWTLDDVYVTGVSHGTIEGEPVSEVTFQAAAVRLP
jgi:hypothetical protein